MSDATPVDTERTAPMPPITAPPPPAKPADQLVEAAIAAGNGGPIPHDGMKSRRFIGSTIFALLILVAASGMALISGHWSENAWFPADYWIKALWPMLGILAFGWGLMTVDKAIELIKLITPTVALYLRAKLGVKG